MILDNLRLALASTWICCDDRHSGSRQTCDYGCWCLYFHVPCDRFANN